MAQLKEFYSRIVHKHDTEANWNKATAFVPLQGEIIIYDKDENYNYERIKIGNGETAVPNLPFTVTTASGTVPGITLVYPAASCTTFSSDSGTVTPLAVQKGAKMFAITRPASSTTNAIVRYSNTAGDVQDSKILIENVTNTKDTSKTANVLSIPAEGGKKMVYGYCTDQVDGTSFIGGVFPANATEFPYASGLAIGGTSGNLLWKGSRVLDNNDLTTINNALSGKAASSHGTHVSYGTSATAIGATASAGSATTVSRSDHTHSLSKNAVTTALGYTPPTADTNTTYSAGTGISLSGTTFSNSGVRSISTGSSNGTISVNTNGTTANVSVKGLGSAAYTASTAYAASNHTHDDRYYTENECKAEFMGWNRGAFNLNELYDAKVYMQAQGTNAPSGSQYGVVLGLPYRKFDGNKIPDFGAQIFIPNGDDSTHPNSMFYRTSLSNSWNDWQEVATKNEVMLKAGGTFTGNVKAISTNRNTSGGCLRNILVVDSTGNTLQSTDRIYMYRQ